MGPVISIGVIATLINMAAAVKNGKPTTEAILGGFVVTTIMLLVSQTKAKPIAVMLMLAFAITSASTNGAQVLGIVNSTVQGTNKGMNYNG